MKLPPENLNKYIAAFNIESAGTSERGLVLVAVSIFDDILEKMLREFFVGDFSKDLFDANGPFASFSGRINTCHALGLIAMDEASSLHGMRRIRNDFAHQIDAALDDPSLRDRCTNIAVALVGNQLLENFPTVRGRFQVCSMRLMQILLARRAEAHENARVSPADNVPLTLRGYNMHDYMAWPELNETEK